MRPSTKLKWLALGSLVAAWLVYAAGFASTGSFLVDEVIYSAMIERFATTGALTIPNGYEDHPSASLLIKYLVAGPNGTVPQYPSGYAVLAAPFYLIGGLHGVVFLNALAAALTLVVLYPLAKTLFENRELALNAALIFGFAAFTTEYALGIWPHAVAVLFVTLAAYCAALSVRAGKRPNWRYAMLAGLVVGLGTTIRVDVFIAAPVIAVWLLGSARRPVIWTGAFSLGASAGLIVSAWMNHVKFGSWMPVSYGHGLGATALGAYLPLLPLGLAAAAGATALAVPRVQDVLLGKRGALLTVGALAIIMLSPWTREASFRLIDGLYVLLVDFQSYPNIADRLGAQRLEGGPVLLFGLLKKALFQSLPFLGFLVLPLARLFQPERRSAYALCCLFPAVWFIPFAYLYWYGGMASNMRYFTPTLPFLAILAASALDEIHAYAPTRRSWVVAGGVLVFLAACIAFGLSRASLESIIFSAHLLFPNVLFFGATATALLWVALPHLRIPMSGAALVVFATGLAWASYTSLVFDPLLAQTRRNNVLVASDTFSRIEKNAHVIASQPEMFLFQLLRRQATLAMYTGMDEPVDYALIEDALAQGRPVYAHTSVVADAITAHANGARYIVTPRSDDPKGLYAVAHEKP